MKAKEGVRFVLRHGLRALGYGFPVSLLLGVGLLAFYHRDRITEELPA